MKELKLRKSPLAPSKMRKLPSVDVDEALLKAATSPLWEEPPKKNKFPPKKKHS